MHETILKTLTVGVVGGLIVYYLTSRREYAHHSESPASYKPTFGDVRTVRFGTPTCADCQCCGLPAPNAVPYPLASDYLCCAPAYAAPVSKWNIGASIQLTCDKLDMTIYRKETATTFPHGIAGIDSTPNGVELANRVSCNPDVHLQIDCIETV